MTTKKAHTKIPREAFGYDANETNEIITAITKLNILYTNKLQDYQTKTDGRIRRLEDKHKRDIQGMRERIERLEYTVTHQEEKKHRMSNDIQQL